MIKRQAQATKDLAKVERIKAKAKLKKALKFSERALAKELVKEAKAVGASAKVAEKYAPKVAKKVASWVNARAEVTQEDINRVVAKEVEKYNKDLAFAYKNRGKII